MRKILLATFLVVLMFASCCGPRSSESIPLVSSNFRGYLGNATDEFLINCWYKDKILGKIYGSPDSVEVSETGVNIHNGCMISFFSDKMTTFDADLFIRVPYGDGVRFYFRASGKDFEIGPKIKFEFTTKSCSIFENEKFIVRVDSIKLVPNFQYRVFLQNEGSLVHVIVGTDTVWQGRTRIPLSEYIYIEPIGGAVTIEDVYFYNLLP